MENLVTITLRMQQAAFQSYLGVTRMMVESGLHIMEQQQRLMLHTWTPHRVEDSPIKIKSRKSRPRKFGAELANHYGKRHLDVDVEHI